MVRNNYEAEFIKELESVVRKTLKAKSDSIPIYKKQFKENRIGTDGNTYFQFGDFRVDLGNFYLVVEVESSGGLTNLLKYWYCLVEHADKIDKPIVLLHVYMQWTDNDYGAHLKLWDFLSNKIQISKDIKQKIVMERYSYHTDKDLENFLKVFKGYLKRQSLE